jgi:putative adhesin
MASRPVQPGQGALQHPSVRGQPLAGLNASTGNPPLDAALAQVSAAVTRIVSFIGMEFLRPPLVLNLRSAQIILTGGLTADDVLFNVLGSGSVRIASSAVNGILLALNRSVHVTGGALNGEIVGGTVRLSGGKVNDPPPVVPEANTFLVLIPVIGAILFSASWRFLRGSPAD